MSNEEILKLAREAGAYKYREAFAFEGNELQAFASAVIKAHTEELIDGAGEPVGSIELCEKCGTAFGSAYYCPKCGHNTCSSEPAYSASQVAAAVAKERAEYQASMDHQNAMARQRKERIATLESTLRLALEALEKSRGLEQVDIDWVKGQRKAAINHLKEVLYAE